MFKHFSVLFTLYNPVICFLYSESSAFSSSVFFCLLYCFLRKYLPTNIRTCVHTYKYANVVLDNVLLLVSDLRDMQIKRALSWLIPGRVGGPCFLWSIFFVPWGSDHRGCSVLASCAFGGEYESVAESSAVGLVIIRHHGCFNRRHRRGARRQWQ